MEILFSKLLPRFIYPLGFSILLILVVFVCLKWRKRRLALWLLIFPLTLLYFSSMPVISQYLIRTLETKYAYRSIQRYPQAGAIVVLGGGVATVRPGSLTPRPNTSYDRLYQGYRLYQAGKASLIVLSGGSISWRVQDESATGSELMAKLLRDLGVPEKAIVLEARSRNTHENACNTAEILRKRDAECILLATSALHMPRAAACFASTGLEVVPAPAAYRIDVRHRTSILDFLPDANALGDTTDVFKEYLGMVYYKSRGWIE